MIVETAQVRHIRILLRVLVPAFLINALLFVFYPVAFLDLLAGLSTKMFPNLLPVVIADTEFYSTLAVSLLVLLSLLALYIQRDVVRYFSFVPLILVAKFCSATLFFILFFAKMRSIDYLVGFYVDATVFMTVFYFYWRARRQIQHDHT